jgi:hypothetical protein
MGTVGGTDSTECVLSTERRTCTDKSQVTTETGRLLSLSVKPRSVAKSTFDIRVARKGSCETESVPCWACRDTPLGPLDLESPVSRPLRSDCALWPLRRRRHYRSGLDGPDRYSIGLRVTSEHSRHNFRALTHTPGCAPCLLWTGMQVQVSVFALRRDRPNTKLIRAEDLQDCGREREAHASQPHGSLKRLACRLGLPPVAVLPPAGRRGRSTPSWPLKVDI